VTKFTWYIIQTVNRSKHTIIINNDDDDDDDDDDNNRMPNTSCITGFSEKLICISSFLHSLRKNTYMWPTYMHL